jgi:hypothetical protein
MFSCDVNSCLQNNEICSFSVSCVFNLIIVIDLRNNGCFYVLLIMYMPACYLILFP